jgi:hypothetical protein
MSLSPCWAEIPHLINYQGMLTDNGGTPLSGDFDLTFTIYDAPTNGTALWTETHTAVPVENGLFNVILGGETTPIPASVFDAPERYLGIKVETDPELTPRIQLTSMGYAYRTEMAGHAIFADSAGITTPGSGSNWTLNNSVLYTNEYWGISRGGTANNALHGNGPFTMVNLGVSCTTGTISENHYYSTISGGYGNRAASVGATVGGGKFNYSRGDYSVIAGGGGSYASDSNSATGDGSFIGGGSKNMASGFCGAITGGITNTVSSAYATVGGGRINVASGNDATVAGGGSNTASAMGATVSGGGMNTASGIYSVVSGGGGTAPIYSNLALGNWSTVPGGRLNQASGDYSYAAGRRAKANHTGTFVWADSTDTDFASTGANQFLIRASGGVGIGTNNPQRILHIKGDNPRILIEASSISPEVNFKNTGDLDLETWALYKHGTTDDFRFYQNGDKLSIQNSTGNVGIGTSSPTEKLDVNGTVRLRVIGETNSLPYVIIDNNGVLYRETFPSSRRYKENIRNINTDPEKILELQTVRFKWKESGKEDVGLIAEDVERAVPDLVIHDDQGRPNGGRYDKLALYLLQVVKEQHENLNDLKTENQQLEKRIEALESKE